MPGSPPGRNLRPISEKDKFSKTIRLSDHMDNDQQHPASRTRGHHHNRPVSQLSDESSASSVGGVLSGSPHVINGPAPTVPNDSSSELSENEARIGSWVAGVQARKCSPRKVLKIDSDQNAQGRPFL